MGKNRQHKSGDPRVRQQDSQPLPPTPAPTAATLADSWVSKVEGTGIEIVQLPSGNAARVRRSGPEAFMAQGIIPDPLTAIVEKAIQSKKGLRPKDEADMARDPKKLGALVEMLDRTLCYAVVEPAVVMPPTCIHVIEHDGPEEKMCGELDTATATQHSDREHPNYHEFMEGERKPGVLYADRVDMEDKLFIMQFTLGGTRDLERFRQQQRSGMASIPTV